jgi:YVTN family beta-propeller protein
LSTRWSTHYHPPADVAVVNAKSNLIVYTVALPRTSGFDVSTTAIAVNPSGADAYVTDFYSTDVSIIDTAAYGLSGNVVSLPGNDIDDVVFTPNGQRAYMIDDAHTVYAVDTARRSVLATITLGEGDQTDGGHMAVTPDGDFVYATGFVAGAVFVIDTSTNTLATTIQLEKGLEGIAIATLPKGCVGPPPPPTSTPTPTATPTPGTCVGDCDGSGDVQINEIITCVNIALGSEPLSTCTACDENGDGQVEINEIITAVKNALNGCP